MFQFTDSAGSPANALTVTQSAYIAGAPGTSIVVNSYSTLYVTLNQQNWSWQLGACCTGNYTWSYTGTLPSGISLSSGGLLSGTPSEAGTYKFLVRAGNGSDYGVRQIVIVVTPLVAANGGSLPYGNVSVAYSRTLTAGGGTGSLTWSLVPGFYLPPGLSLNGATGVLGGTPTAAGSYGFSVYVSDSAGHTALEPFNLNIYPAGGSPPVGISTGANLGTWSIGEIQTQLVANGGSGAYTWSLAGGKLPPGLALRTDVPPGFPPDASAGLIGVATTPGTYTFTLQAASGSQTLSQAFTMKITGLTGRGEPAARCPTRSWASRRLTATRFRRSTTPDRSHGRRSPTYLRD